MRGIPGISPVVKSPLKEMDASIMGCYQSKRDRIEVIDAEILEFRIAMRNLKRGIDEANEGIAFYEDAIKALEKEKLDLQKKILAEQDSEAKKQKDE